MSLEEYTQKRENVLKCICRIKNLIEQQAIPPTELKCRLEILENYFKQILELQNHIEGLDSSDSERAEIEDLYVATKSKIQQQLAEEQHNSTIVEHTFAVPAVSSKLPALKLPAFGGKYSEYKNFISSFTQIIDKEVNLTNIEKFNHLLNCLHGQALETVKAFQITAENYPKALGRLKTRYDNNTLIFMENITTLFELPKVPKQNATQLRSLVDNVSALYSSLLSLGNDKDICNAMLIFLVMDKVDAESQRKWKESLDFSKVPTWEECTSILDRHCQYLESMDNNHSNSADSINLKKKSFNDKRHTLHQGSSFSVTKRVCVLCTNADHPIRKCSRFLAMNVPDRFNIAKRLGLCINCLANTHQLTNCPSTHKCKVCSRSHHSLLHRGQPQSQLTLSPTFPETTTPNNTASTHSHVETFSQEQVILATALVLVRDYSGVFHVGRALLDSCSQVNFVTENFAQKLRLPRERQSVRILSIGDSHTTIKHKASTTIRSRFTDLELSLKFCITPHISYQPDNEIDVSTLNLPANIQLADENFFKSNRIDMLLGAESFYDLLSVGQVKLGDGLPTLQKTLLGWVVAGRYKNNKICSSDTSQSSCVVFQDDSINESLEKLWKIEEISPSSNRWTDEQVKCESFYTKTVSRNVEGRIIVRLPFKDDPSDLGYSYNTALRRFLAQELRLSRNNDLKIQYRTFMDEYEKLGHMTVVENQALESCHYYIPHHCILKPTSTSTKLRVVFDASCVTTSQKSLNELLMVGPTVQKDLFSLLICFRLYRYALTADIVKMYRQVLVDKKDRKYQYILWRSSENDEIQTYALNTVTYGTAAAPFLAVRSLNYLADQYSSDFKVGSEIIKSSFYVDDLLCGADSISQLKRIKVEVIEILKRGCFELAKWHSNYLELMDDKTIKDISIEEDSVTSALGLAWDQSKDNFDFSFTPKIQINSKITKRNILSVASSLFDPLGVLAPLIIKSKIILQELWLLKLEWDESVPQSLHTAWEIFLNDMSHLPLISIPRYCSLPGARSIQLHGFCDASIRAYGCCFYLRIEDGFGSVTVRLLTAKSRVAPTKKKSLPKLELCGAQLLSKLFEKIKSSLINLTTVIYLWTDSQIVLHWLKLHSATLSTFVGNRVSEIQDLTSECHWRHVPTKENPADVVSRGSEVGQLIESMWFTGPSFLLQTEQFWPVNKCNNFDVEEFNREKRKSTFTVSLQRNYLLQIIDNSSSYLKILRIMAWVLRFCKKLTKTDAVQFDVNTLSAQELEKALCCIVWIIQQTFFKNDISSLEKNRDIGSFLQHLNPFLQETDGYKLLKVGGRLELADIPDNQKHPTLLPSKCKFVETYVRHLHHVNYHAGPKALIALIRRRFWIVNARSLARQIVSSCVHCTRYKPRLLDQIMGNLPVERITQSRPFARCAVDFCGPVNTYLRIRGKVPYKTYVAVFVCLSTKAVHIEVVSDLSTDAFMASLKRLVGRRGLPTDIFCDNATNFAGAANKLADLKALFFDSKNQNTIVNYCSNQFINFRFIPPRAPHFGGLWEAAVKTAKGHLYRTVMNARLTFEELSTALVEIEAVMNSRPISPLSNDPSDLEALTPAHFIIGTSLKAIPEKNIQGEVISHIERWSRITAIKQHFWQRWSHDYLNELQSRTKWAHDKPNLHIGSLVLVHEDNVPPQRWVLGRVEKCVPGKDNRVRVVDVRTTRGILRRPIHKLALLPV